MRLLGLVLVLLADLATAQSPVSERHPLALDGSVRVQVVAGSLRILSSKEPMVRLEGTLGEKVERLEVEARPGRIEIRPILPRQTQGLSEKDLAVHLELTIPEGAALEASTVSAPLSVAGVVGRLTLQSVSGPIRAEAPLEGKACPEATVNAVSGEVRLDLPLTRLALSSTSGPVTVSGLVGEASVRTVSGPVRLEGVRLRRIQAHSVSGSLDLHAGLAEEGTLSASTVSGALTLNLPANIGATLSLATLSGGIESAVPLTEPTRRWPGSGRNATGSLGSGSGRIEARTISGTIRIVKG